MEEGKLLNRSKLTQQQDIIKDYGTMVDTLIERVTREFSKDLDKYITDIKPKLIATNRTITDLELEEIILTLPQLIYWASEGQERLAIKEDIAHSLRNEKYLDVIKDKEGSISVKNMQAELDILTEDYTELIYSHAVKQLKTKVTYAMEILQSVKKILSKRMADSEWVMTQGNKRRPQPQDGKRDRF